MLSKRKKGVDLHSQTIYEKGVEMAIISELSRNNKGGSWAIDMTEKAAICACRKQEIQEVLEFPKIGFVRAKIAGFLYA